MGRIMATPVKLQFAAPKRGMPPAHMADFDSETLQQKIQELGLPKFRADQIRRQYFGRLQGDPMKMTDPVSYTHL